MILPYAGISEPIRVYYDGINNKSRTGEALSGESAVRCVCVCVCVCVTDGVVCVCVCVCV
jgi:hypothetical protein